MNVLKKITVLIFLLVMVCPAWAFDLFEGLDINIFSGDKKEAEVLWENGPNQYFKYVSQDSTEFGPNDHPVELDQKSMALSLSLLRVKSKKSVPVSEMSPVFTSDQVVLLSKMLVTGLKKAKPDKDIIFVLEKSEQKLMGLKKEGYFTAGRAFYKDKKLNLILGDYKRVRNRGYEAAYDPSNAGIVTYTFDHGARSKTSSGSYIFDKAIYEFAGVENKKQKGIRHDWFVVDLQVAAEGYAHREEQAKKEEMIRKRKEIEEIFGQSFPPALGNSSQGFVAAPVPTKSTEDRLVALNKLKEKGLITEEEYSRKRQQILDEL